MESAVCAKRRLAVETDGRYCPGWVGVIVLKNIERNGIALPDKMGVDSAYFGLVVGCGPYCDYQGRVHQDGNFGFPMEDGTIVGFICRYPWELHDRMVVKTNDIIAQWIGEERPVWWSDEHEKLRDLMRTELTRKSA